MFKAWAIVVVLAGGDATILEQRFETLPECRSAVTSLRLDYLKSGRLQVKEMLCAFDVANSGGRWKWLQHEPQAAQ